MLRNRRCERCGDVDCQLDLVRSPQITPELKEAPILKFKLFTPFNLLSLTCRRVAAVMSP